MSKKLVLLFSLIVVILFHTSSITAQEEFPRWNFGIKGGMNIASKYDEDSPSKIGYLVKGHVDYNFDERYFLRSEFGTTLKGTSHKTSDEYFDEESTITTFAKSNIEAQMQYLQLSISPGFRIPIEDNMTLGLNLGMYLDYGIAISGKYDTRYEQYVDASQISNSSLKSEFGDWDHANLRRIDYGLTAAVEVKYCNFTLSLAYERGLTDIYKEKAPYMQPPYKKWHVRNTNIAIGYTY